MNFNIVSLFLSVKDLFFSEEKTSQISKKLLFHYVFLNNCIYYLFKKFFTFYVNDIQCYNKEIKIFFKLIIFIFLFKSTLF